MTDQQHSIGIVGAGSVGVNTAYDLIRAGVHVTFLVRPHRLEQLSRPQVMYSYDDNTLDQFDGYDVITDPADLAGKDFDFLIVTLDNAALQSESGLALVKEIGRAFTGTNTGVIVAAVGLGVRSWFIEQSGLPAEQVVLGNTGALIHEVAAANLPVDPAVDADLLAQADYAYRHLGAAGFTINDSVPELAEKFTAIYSGNGIPAADVAPADQSAAGVAILAPILAWGLLDYQPLTDIDASNEAWQLGVNTTREIQQLPILGDAGKSAAEQTTAEGLLGMFQQMTEVSKPLSFAGFNAYHHGGKVNRQDLDFLDDARQRAEDAGQDVPALREMISRLRNA